jgi:DNA polymerase-4
MNSFFASVEELQNPSYKNKPIAVSGYTKRSVVSSANYIARQNGVKAAMPIFMAKKLCPDLIIANHHFHLYHEYSEKFIELISEKFTNNIEIGSIDECYVDVTSLVNKTRTAIDIANQIQQSIKRKIGLNCSIGVANNKFLAKMGSDYKKPMGVTTMWLNEIETKL